MKIIREEHEVSPEQESQLRAEWDKGWDSCVKKGWAEDLGEQGEARLTASGVKEALLALMLGCPCAECRVLRACLKSAIS